MKDLLIELERSFEEFSTKLKDGIPAIFTSLDIKKDIYKASYRRLASLQGWRSYVVEPVITKEVTCFFIEAQNDALLSHTFARIGSWRASLKSLRGLLDNLLFFLYYKDHPVEFQLWSEGRHSLPISEYVTYLSNHPLFVKYDDSLTGLDSFRKEYSVLSKAVHASSGSFRMTEGGQYPAIMIDDLSRLGKWVTRERETIRIANMILITMFQSDLESAKQLQLRKSISFAVPKSFHAKIRSELNVRLISV